MNSPKTPINFYKATKKERADYFGSMAIESLTEASKIEKERQLALIIRQSYYHNLIGYPPEKTWEELNYTEQTEWLNVAGDLIENINRFK